MTLDRWHRVTRTVPLTSDRARLVLIGEVFKLLPT
jgi:hypothetical protein